eukprot:359937-Chlamydomonas_euryale.AAC.1
MSSTTGAQGGCSRGSAQTSGPSSGGRAVVEPQVARLWGCEADAAAAGVEVLVRPSNHELIRAVVQLGVVERLCGCHRRGRTSSLMTRVTQACAGGFDRLDRLLNAQRCADGCARTAKPPGCPQGNVEHA